MLVVVKIGGEVLRGPEGAALAADVSSLHRDGHRVCIVHGGGVQASEIQKQLGVPVHKVGGRRITDQSTLDIMKMVLAGQVNVDLCSLFLSHGVKPVGLHGASSQVVAATKRPPRAVSGSDGKAVDFQFVGDIQGINEELIRLLWTGGYVPVIASLGCDDSGQVFNINADVVANQLAKALGADRLFLVTSVPGVLGDINDPASRLTTLTRQQAKQAIDDKVIVGGMIPKVEEAMAVLGSGVGAIHIVGKLTAGDLLKEAAEPGSVGTALLP